eukprot:11502494-Karenia_brevis.AAC.1
MAETQATLAAIALRHAQRMERTRRFESTCWSILLIHFDRCSRTVPESASSTRGGQLNAEGI